MIIVVEGPDNAGKSTLIRHLATELGVEVIPGEGPGRSEGEINERVRRYATIDNAIFDRHPCVSQLIYNHFRQGPKIDPQLVNEFYEKDVVFIYCRGRLSLAEQVVKDYDIDVTDSLGVVHADTVSKHHLSICATYDEWALSHAHFVYRIGDGFERVRSFVRSQLLARDIDLRGFDPVADIAEFHTKFELMYDGPVRALPKDLSQFRVNFMDEELGEYSQHEAAAHMERYVHSESARDLGEYAIHLEHMLDALVDLVYVALGTSYLHGFNFKEAWRRVHAANIRKVRARREGDSKRGSTWDVVKPEGWEPPSHIDLVEVNDLSSKRSAR